MDPVRLAELEQHSYRRIHRMKEAAQHASNLSTTSLDNQREQLWALGSATSSSSFVSKPGTSPELEAALERVKEANEEADEVHRSLRLAEIEKKQRLYVEAQQAYLRKREEAKQQEVEDRRKHTEIVKQESLMRKEEELTAAKKRHQTTLERLKQQSKKEQEELALEQHEKALKLATQARWMEAHERKKREAERKAREKQEEIAAEREAEKKETKAYEEAKEQRRLQQLASMRKSKEDAWEKQKLAEKELKAREEEETKARFKAREAERIRREAEKRAQERADAKTAREIARKKAQEEQRKKKEEKQAAAKALKQALAEAQAAQYEQDERGKLVKKLDPTKELEKKMRLLEEEQLRMQKDRDAELAAKEAAFQKAQKEQAFQRALQVQAAQREVAATFKKNQEKELRDRLAREAAEKERCQRAAKEMREKIEAELQRRLEAERQAAVNLKEMKAAQYEADLAAHKRRQHMEELKAKQNRTLQEVVWKDVMAWDRKVTQEQRNAKQDAVKTFNGNRAMQLDSHDDQAAAALKMIKDKERAAEASRRQYKAKARVPKSANGGSSRRRTKRRAVTERTRSSPTGQVDDLRPPTWNWGHFGALWYSDKGS